MAASIRPATREQLKVSIKYRSVMVIQTSKVR